MKASTKASLATATLLMTLGVLLSQAQPTTVLPQHTPTPGNAGVSTNANIAPGVSNNPHPAPGVSTNLPPGVSNRPLN
jgi:hypothetical protein